MEKRLSEVDDTSADPPAAAHPPMGRVMLSAGAGIIVENYDYALYGFFATTIASVFFEQGDPVAALLATTAVFAAGFLARPLGGFFFGWIGDTKGRRTALILSVAITSAATLMIGLLPGYAVLGMLSPILILVARMGQSFGAAGEYAASAAYVLEFASQEKRGRYASIAPLSSGIGYSLGALVAILTIQVWGVSAEDWGWRIPFLVALPLGLIALYIRSHLGETNVFEKLKDLRGPNPQPLRSAFRFNWRSIISVFGWSIANSIGFYVMVAYFQTYMVTVGGFELQQAQISLFAAMFVFSLSTIGVGRLAERVSRRTLAVGGVLLLAAATVPTFAMMQSGDHVLATVGQCVFALLLPTVVVSTALSFVDMFPPAVRASGSSFSYNMAQVIFGGTAPFVGVWLSQAFGSFAIAYYVIAACIVAALCAFFGFVRGEDRFGVAE